MALAVALAFSTNCTYLRIWESAYSASQINGYSYSECYVVSCAGESDSLVCGISTKKESSK